MDARWCFKCESCGKVFSLSNEVMSEFYNRLREDPQHKIAASMVLNTIVSCCKDAALTTLLKPTEITSEEIHKYFNQRLEDHIKREET